MRWKALLTIIIVLMIASLMIMTETGRKYTQFLREKVGAVISLVSKFGQPVGDGFEFILNTNMDAFVGQSYEVVNSSLAMSGVYNYIKIGNQLIELKEGKRVELFVDNMKGNFEITKAGSIKIAVDSNYVEIDDLKFLGQTRIEAEVIPDEFTLSDLTQNKITLSSVTGSIKRFYDGNEGQESLDGIKMEINRLSEGQLKLSNDKVTLEGSVVSIVTNKFTWI